MVSRCAFVAAVLLWSGCADNSAPVAGGPAPPLPGAGAPAASGAPAPGTSAAPAVGQPSIGSGAGTQAPMPGGAPAPGGMSVPSPGVGAAVGAGTGGQTMPPYGGQGVAASGQSGAVQGSGQATVLPPTGSSLPGQVAGAPQQGGAATAAPAGPVVMSGDYKGLGGAINTWWSQPGEIKGATLLDPKEPVLAGYGWMVHLLPHLGYQDLYGKFDFKKKWDEKENLQLTAVVIPAFLDPTNAKQRWEGYPFVGDGPGLTHYVGMSGIEDTRNVVAANLPRSDPRAGIFGYEQVARMNDVADGTANTIMVIGSGRVSGPWIQGGGATIRGARAPKDQPGASYFHEITGFGSSGSPGSGAVTLMADGSVRVISKDIDPAVFRALCTIHGAESIDMQVLDTHAPRKP